MIRHDSTQQLQYIYVGAVRSFVCARDTVEPFHHLVKLPFCFSGTEYLCEIPLWLTSTRAKEPTDVIK